MYCFTKFCERADEGCLDFPLFVYIANDFQDCPVVQEHAWANGLNRSPIIARNKEDIVLCL